MDIRYCKICGALFQYNGSRVCPKCEKVLEDKLTEIKEYLREHTRATVMEVSDEFDVPVKQIHQWIQEERLMFAPGVSTGLVCQRCGIPIDSGKLCKKCANGLSQELNQAQKKTGVCMNDNRMQNPNGKMHLSKYGKKQE